MTPRYREEKTTQAAGYLLRLRGGKMSYLKLLKLLYFADRTALLELGRPISFDKYVSMDNGPVLSRTCDLIKARPVSNSARYWRHYIAKSKTDAYDVCLLKDTPTDQLSPAEEDILARIFKKYGHKWRFDLVHLSHKLPEYREPQGGALPIAYRDILLGEGRSAEDARAIEDDLAAEDAFYAIAR